MQVFKCALRILRGNLVFPLIYIVGLSFMGLLMAVSFNFGTNQSEQFQRESFDFAVIDRDDSPLSESITDFLGQRGEEVTVEDNKIAIQDAAAKGRIDYLLIIPKGFQQQFLEAAHIGEEPKPLETVFSFYSGEGVSVDGLVDEYLNVVRTLSIAEPSQDISDLITQATDLSSKQAESVIIPSDSAIGEADRFVFYMQWSTYTLFSGIVVCVGLLTSILGRSDIRRRNLSSPLTYLSYNGQLALACALITIVAWGWTFGLGCIAFPQAVAQITPTGLMLSGLSMLAFALVPLAFGYMLGALNASAMVCNAVGNIAGLIISFMGGAWISLDLMTPEVSMVAHWLPGFWYADSCSQAAHLSAVPNAEVIFAILQCLGVLALFAVAFFCVALLVGKLRLRKQGV